VRQRGLGEQVDRGRAMTGDAPVDVAGDRDRQR
jgi:hypothetical protein